MRAWRPMIKLFNIYHTAVLVARKVKILPCNPLVVVVSPLNALISDQPESCQRLKLKAVEISGSRSTIVSLAAVCVTRLKAAARETIRQRRFTEGARSRSALLQSGTLGKHPIQVVLFNDGRSVDWNCSGEITVRSQVSW